MPHRASKGGITPGPLRAGGATRLYELTEDIPLLCRRARWARPETLEAYVQETSAVHVLSQVSADRREELAQVARSLPGALSLAVGLHAAGVPRRAFYAYFLCAAGASGNAA